MRGETGAPVTYATVMGIREAKRYPNDFRTVPDSTENGKDYWVFCPSDLREHFFLTPKSGY